MCRPSEASLIYFSKVDRFIDKILGLGQERNWQYSLNKVSLSLSKFVEGAIKLVNSCCSSHLASLHH